MSFNGDFGCLEIEIINAWIERGNVGGLCLIE